MSVEAILAAIYCGRRHWLRVHVLKRKGARVLVRVVGENRLQGDVYSVPEWKVYDRGSSSCPVSWGEAS